MEAKSDDSPREEHATLAEQRGYAGRRRAGRPALLALLAGLGLLTFAAVALAATGKLTQTPGTDGCISETGTSGACADGVALGGAFSVTVSPDDKTAYVASTAASAIAVFDRDKTTGALTQKPGTDGCISETGTGGACADGVALNGASSVTVSPDGTSAYVASFDGDAVAVFDRDSNTGALTQKPGTDACVSETGTGGACADGVALDQTRSVIVSPDGESAYAAASSSDAIAVFDRDPTTGALTQKPGTDGCISETGTGGACTDGVALNGASSVAGSPDGKSAYVASPADDAIAVFDRDPSTGALTQKAGTDGCISETGTGGACADGVALDQATSVIVSPDGESAYAASRFSDAVAAFDRDPTTGALTQKNGTDACVSETGTGGACADGVALDGAVSVTVSPDGTSAYVASVDSDAVAAFDRDPTTGALTQKTGTDACVSETGTGGACADGVALDFPFSVTASDDGRNAYAASSFSAAVAVFGRDDGIAPTTRITSGPEGITNDPSPSFGFTSNEAGSSFECRLDSEPFTACSSPKSYSNLPDGSHTFAVRATDSYGNTEEPPAERTFTVETTVPDTTIDGKATAKKKQKQKGKKIAIKAKVSASEDLSATGKGKIKVGKKSYKLGPFTNSVSSGDSKSLKLKPKKSKDAKKIAKALKKGKKATAKLTVKLTDDAGNTETEKLSVKLKR